MLLLLLRTPKRDIIFNLMKVVSILEEEGRLYLCLLPRLLVSETLHRQPGADDRSVAAGEPGAGLPVAPAPLRHILEQVGG